MEPLPPTSQLKVKILKADSIWITKIWWKSAALKISQKQLDHQFQWLPSLGPFLWILSDEAKVSSSVQNSEEIQNKFKKKRLRGKKYYNIGEKNIFSSNWYSWLTDYQSWLFCWPRNIKWLSALKNSKK